MIFILTIMLTQPTTATKLPKKQNKYGLVSNFRAKYFMAISFDLNMVTYSQKSWSSLEHSKSSFAVMFSVKFSAKNTTSLRMFLKPALVNFIFLKQVSQPPKIFSSSSGNINSHRGVLFIRKSILFLHRNK